MHLTAESMRVNSRVILTKETCNVQACQYRIIKEEKTKDKINCDASATPSIPPQKKKKKKKKCQLFMC